ncbi:hypothetical protein FB451DRAFT_1185260 [Mycena latifolia]|nr:hypothetical protein FB451DRAFT_1185260 [Mycena latifolia]
MVHMVGYGSIQDSKKYKTWMRPLYNMKGKATSYYELDRAQARQGYRMQGYRLQGYPMYARRQSYRLYARMQAGLPIAGLPIVHQAGLPIVRTQAGLPIAGLPIVRTQAGLPIVRMQAGLRNAILPIVRTHAGRATDCMHTGRATDCTHASRATECNPTECTLDQRPSPSQHLQASRQDMMHSIHAQKRQDESQQ